VSSMCVASLSASYNYLKASAESSSFLSLLMARPGIYSILASHADINGKNPGRIQVRTTHKKHISDV
jgi:hypothetical protein